MPTMITKTDQKPDEIDEKIDRKIGVFIEHMNDQFERVIEGLGPAVDAAKALPRINQRLETIENDIAVIKLDGIKRKPAKK